MYFFIEPSAKSCVNIKTPIVPLEDLPYTLSMVATITSQHGIERVQSNCSLSPMQYLADDKTSAQVNRKGTILSVPSVFTVDLVIIHSSHIYLASSGHAWRDTYLPSLLWIKCRHFSIQSFLLLLIVLPMEEAQILTLSQEVTSGSSNMASVLVFFSGFLG